MDESAQALLEQVRVPLSHFLGGLVLTSRERFWTLSLQTARMFMNSSPTASLLLLIGTPLPPAFIPHPSHPEFLNHHLRPRPSALLLARRMPAPPLIHCQTSPSPHRAFINRAVS
jgi:hypothetical protein